MLVLKGKLKHPQSLHNILLRDEIIKKRKKLKFITTLTVLTKAALLPSSGTVNQLHRG